MNILFGGLLLLSTNILQGYGQNISESRDLTATLNQDLTLSWTFSGSTAFKIAAFQLFKDSIAPLNLLNFGSLTILSPQGKAAFGERFVIEKNDWSAGELITKLKNVQFNDTGRIFILNILYQIGETIINPPRQSTYNISKVEDPSIVVTTTEPNNDGGGGTTGGSSDDSNGGLIAGVIIGLIFLIIIVVVCFVLFKRYKKNKRSNQGDAADTNLKCATNED